MFNLTEAAEEVTATFGNESNLQLTFTDGYTYLTLNVKNEGHWLAVNKAVDGKIYTESKIDSLWRTFIDMVEEMRRKVRERNE